MRKKTHSKQVDHNNDITHSQNRLAMSPDISIVDEETQRKHDELFKKNHILSTLDMNVDTSFARPNKSLNSFSEDPNDSISSDLSIITHQQVLNDPKTPIYREEYRRKQPLQDTDFSPVPTTSKKHDQQRTPLSGLKPRLDLHRKSLKNRVLSYSSSSSSDLMSEVSTPVADKPKIPNSILKKNVNYDKATSQKLVELKPELSSALNSDGELNPLKASKRIVISPKKEYITSKSSLLSRSAKFSSPLTDAIDGKASRRFKSPYVKESPKKKRAEINNENEWLDEDENGPKAEKKEKRQKKKRGVLSKILNTLVDPQLPYVLSLYLQLMFNVALVSILLFFIYSFISTVKADVENKVDSYATDILQEIALCSREYIRNNCQPGQRVVALEAACSEWEKCMNRDPTTVGRAKIGAETFAEIINGFIKPISWKSMFFLLLITVGSLVLTNAAFGTYRNYTHPEQHQQSLQSQQPPIPHTPYQQQIQYNPAYTRYYTPKASSPTNLAMVRHKSRSSRKPSKNRQF